MISHAKYLKIQKIIIFILAAFIIGTTGILVKATTIEKEVEDYFNYNDRPEKIIYLTFDDGPSIYTSKLLEILKEYEVPAIFFVLGESLEVVPNSHELLKEIVAQNHHVGLHSMSHNRSKLYNNSNSPQNFVNEMLELKKLIYEITGGYETDLCRAPYGKKEHFKAGHWTAVEKAGLYCIDWNIDSLDWSKKSTDQIINQIKKELESEGFPNQVVALFHEKKITVEALPEVINYFREQGYTFVPYIEGEIIDVLEK